MLRIAYLCHPYGGDPENLLRAKRWLRYLQHRYADRAFIAPWIAWIEDCGDDDGEPKSRELGLLRDVTLVEVSDEVWVVGGKVTQGMATEINAARGANVAIKIEFEFYQEPPMEKVA